MAGEKSIKLAHKVRDILGDLNKGRIRNDTIIFDLLSRYQREWMTQLNTTRQVITLTLTTATEYNLDDLNVRPTVLVNKVIKIYTPDAQETDYVISYDKINNKIIIGEETPPVTGEIIYVLAYMKPATAISKTADPVIGDDYEPYLTDAVLTHFPTKDIPQTLENVENVRTRVKRLADSMRNRERNRPGQINQLTYY